MREIVYFRNVLGRDVVKSDSKKVATICNLQYPSDKTELQSFLGGMVNILMRFIPDLSDKTTDVHELLIRNIVFDFNSHYQKIFDMVKGEILDHRTLCIYDPTQKLILELDTNMKGLWACLLQNDKPISYSSKLLTCIEENYSNIERECLTMVFGLKHFRQFCYSHSVVHQIRS